MGNCDTTGLLGVIVEVTLSILICVVADDLDSLLVSTYCTVGTKTPELATYCSSWFCSNFLNLKGCSVYVIFNTDCEVVLWLSLLEVIEYSNDLTRRNRRSTLHGR